MLRHVTTVATPQTQTSSTRLDTASFKTLPRPRANHPPLSFHGAGFLVPKLGTTFSLLWCLVIALDFHPGRLQEPGALVTDAGAVIRLIGPPRQMPGQVRSLTPRKSIFSRF